MCGIAGIWEREGPPVEPRRIARFLREKAHLVERALRRPGCSSALEACAGAYLEAACSLTGPGGRRRIEAYLTLSLARHVGLSTQLEGRGDTTLPLLELCERRLAAEAVPLETEERTHP